MREDETSRLESVGAVLLSLSSCSFSSSPATKRALLPLSHRRVNYRRPSHTDGIATAAVAMEVHSFVSPCILAMLLLHQETPPPLLLLLAVPIPLALWLLPSSRLSNRNFTEGSGNLWFPPRLELQLWEVGSRAAG